MAQHHLDNDLFFTQLAALIDDTQKKGHGSVCLTQKRLTFNASSATTEPQDHDDPLWDLEPPSEPLPILIRATDGKGKAALSNEKKNKTKLSTIVQPDDIDAFFARYADVCKAGMQSLRKRDRSKRKKDKGKKKKKGISGVEE